MPISLICPTCGKTLKAPDAAAGKTGTCPGCKSKFTVPMPEPEPVEEPMAPLPLDDLIPLAPALDALDSGPALSRPEEPDRKPCPKCGEMIVATAAKCRFCGEIFDAKLKKKKKKTYASDDENLTGGDWALCILCGTIACILGIVYMIQGKPKGIKMIGVCFAVQMIGGVIIAILQAAAGN